MDINLLINKLKIKGFIPFYYESTTQAYEKVLEIIPNGCTVGIGGSMTIKQLGIDCGLQNRGNLVYSHSMSPQLDKDTLFKLASESHWYISSCNAITQCGDIVNTDGTANRVSSLIFGVPNIVYVVGKNKIVSNLDSAFDRIKNYCAPLNAKRLNKNTPCAITGKCCDCNCPECICNTTVISHHPTSKQNNVYVILINEDLGL